MNRRLKQFGAGVIFIPTLVYSFTLGAIWWVITGKNSPERIIDKLCDIIEGIK